MVKDSLSDLVIYQIFLDRFHGNIKGDWREPKFIGGNLKGVTDKLDYLKDLGITAIWLSPFYETSAYHGYHITDFTKIDPHFGTLKDLKQLIKKAHSYNIKVFADFVPNHFSYKHSYFQDTQKNKNSKYKQWFYFTKWPDEYKCFLFFDELPKINLDNPEVYSYIIDAANYWLSLGIDGYRLDHVVGPNHVFWKNFSKDIKKNFPHAILFGEATIFGIGRKELRETILADKKNLAYKEERLFGTAEILQRSFRDVFDGNLDFTFHKLTDFFIAKKRWYKPLWVYRILLKLHFSLCPKDFKFFLFLDNHDVERFLFRAGNKKDKLKVALSEMFKQNHPVVLYQGTEMSMSQENSFDDFESHGDLMAREPLDWEHYDENMYSFVKECIKIKKKNH